MQKKISDIKVYYEVVTKVWTYFRKMYSEYDADQALQGVYDFEAWAKYKGPRIYEFGMKMIKLAWQEAGELHEMRKEEKGATDGTITESDKGVMP